MRNGLTEPLRSPADENFGEAAAAAAAATRCDDRLDFISDMLDLSSDRLDLSSWVLMDLLELVLLEEDLCSLEDTEWCITYTQESKKANSLNTFSFGLHCSKPSWKRPKLLPEVGSPDK